MKKLFALFVNILLIFFIATPFAHSAEKQVLLKATKTWDDNAYKKLNINNPEATVLHIKIMPGEILHDHKHQMTNIGCVLSGTLLVTSETGKQLTATKGQCFAELIDTYHRGKNIGQDPVELIVFYLGEKDTQLSVSK